MSKVTGYLLAAALAAGIAGCGTASAARAPQQAAPSASAGVTSSNPSAQAATASPSAEVIAQRLGTGKVTAYTAVTDPNHLLGRQGEYTSKVNWHMPGDATTAGDSSVEVFPTAEQAEMRKLYVSAFQCPIGDGYDYVSGTALLRLSCSYTPSQAAAVSGKLPEAAQAK